MLELLNNFIALFTESAPWLLLGLLIAGFMKWIVPLEFLQKHVGKSDIKSIVKAALIGAPLPLCSCGVIPAAIGLRRAGASKSASISFLVSTPETGIDSISVSYALLGPFIAIIRPVCAIFSAIYSGILVMLVTSNKEDKVITEQAVDHASCCTNDHAKKELVEVSDCEKAAPAVSKMKIIKKVMNVLSFSSGKLLQDITPWLLSGLLLAAAIKTWVPTDFLTQWGDGFLAMLIMALIGVPMYICATASTPIAAGFLAVGVSPGAVLVFMLAGPATNLSTMGMIRQEMGGSVLATYLVSIFSSSIGLGYLINWLIDTFGFYIRQVAANTHQMETSVLYLASTLLLAFFILRNIVKQFKFKTKE